MALRLAVLGDRIVKISIERLKTLKLGQNSTGHDRDLPFRLEGSADVRTVSPVIAISHARSEHIDRRYAGTYTCMLKMAKLEREVD